MPSRSRGGRHLRRGESLRIARLMNHQDLAFTVHDGDLKAGSGPCPDSLYTDAKAMFDRLRARLGDNQAYVLEARALVDEFPDSTWAQETLNNLASHYVILDDNAAADEVFREMVRRFPNNRYAERAYWKIGWWAYRLWGRGAALLALPCQPDRLARLHAGRNLHRHLCDSRHDGIP